MSIEFVDITAESIEGSTALLVVLVSASRTRHKTKFLAIESVGDRVSVRFTIDSVCKRISV